MNTCLNEVDSTSSPSTRRDRTRFEVTSELLLCTAEIQRESTKVDHVDISENSHLSFEMSLDTSLCAVIHDRNFLCSFCIKQRAFIDRL